MNVPPTVGRIVHFFEPESSEPFAALVTGVNEKAFGLAVDLTVFKPGQAPLPVMNVPFCETPLATHRWCWPPRV